MNEVNILREIMTPIHIITNIFPVLMLCNIRAAYLSGSRYNNMGNFGHGKAQFDR